MGFQHTHRDTDTLIIRLWWWIEIRADTTCRSISAMFHALVWQVTPYPDLCDLCGWYEGAYVLHVYLHVCCTLVSGYMDLCVLYMCHSYILCVHNT